MLNLISCLLLSIAPSTYNLDTGWRLASRGDEVQISHPLAVPLPAPGLTTVKTVFSYEYRHIGTITNHTDATLFISLGGSMTYTLSHSTNAQGMFDNEQAGGYGLFLAVLPGETQTFTTLPSTYLPAYATHPIAPWYMPMGPRRLHKFYLTPRYDPNYHIEWIGTPHYSGHYPYSLNYITEARIYGTITYQ